MFGLARREMRFAFLISSTHLAQHFYLRLIPPLIPILAIVTEYPIWQLGLLVSVFYAGGGLSQAPLGVLADRYDRRAILPAGIGVSAACYMVFPFAPALGVVLPDLSLLGYTFEGGFLVMSGLMLVSGIGNAVVHPAGYPMISANVSSENKGKTLGIFGSSAKFGDAIPPLAIGALILVLAWDLILVILGLVGVLYSLALYVALGGDDYETVPETSEGTSDEESETKQRTDPRTYRYPMIVIFLFFVTKMFAANGVNTFVPAFVVAVYSYSFDVGGISLAPESVANFYFAALLICGAVSQLFLGALTDRFDPRLVLLGGVSVGTVVLVVLGSLDLSPVTLLLVMIVLGTSLWGISPARDALISEITPPEREGRTFGYFWTAVNLTGAMMPVLVGYLIETVGMREAFTMLALGTVLAGGTISLLFTSRVYRTGRETPIDADTTD
ncbi:MFS transporter [Natrarchaeobius chitinivorans]|uniref:MFS transporter n=1 Tax=Natrarchaeobius chitinivorans TaxID=1679083 RepID=A0A3N6MFA0_NATCH|nr:MFS transporter [Natrarchaeobius chitinivorans]RQG94251.1 MFS transporter [Natrarchaeobius chitinivorans]